MKTFHGRQPYDLVHRTLLVPHTAVPDDTAFWYNFDWAKALTAGAEATGTPYSGQYLMLSFLIVHVYLTTTGHTPLAHIKAMISGWEERH